MGRHWIHFDKQIIVSKEEPIPCPVGVFKIVLMFWYYALLIVFFAIEL